MKQTLCVMFNMISTCGKKKKKITLNISSNAAWLWNYSVFKDVIYLAGLSLSYLPVSGRSALAW